MKKFLLVLSLLTIIFPLYTKASDTARSSIVMDIDSGRVLYEKNANEKRLIASTTKIMTALLALESGKLNEMVEAKDEILKMYGTSIYLSLHEKMRLEDLVYGLLLRSGNDAAVVIATYLSGSEETFVKEMNKKAKEIGMLNTTFQNAHGLDEETQNYSTAHDMALLSSYVYKNFKKYRTITKTYKYQVQTKEKSYLWYNRNKLLKSYEYCTGGKNGYTPSAGKTLVTTASKDGLNLTVVTLKDGDEYNTHKELYELMFNKYKSYKLIDKDNFNIDDKKLKDKVYINKSFIYPLTEEEKNHIEIKTKVDTNIKKGKIGYMSIKLYNKEIGNIKIYLKEKKSQKKKLFGFLNC